MLCVVAVVIIETDRVAVCARVWVLLFVLFFLILSSCVCRDDIHLVVKVVPNDKVG